MNESMFREYDIRGLVGRDLDEDVMETLGKAFGTYLKSKAIGECVVGHDYRDISESFRIAFVKGLRSTGVDVLDIGMVLTPMLYAAQHHYNIQGGAMITASHNPKGWSGLKLSHGFSKTLGPQEIAEFKKVAFAGKFSEGNGSYKRRQFYSHYVGMLKGKANLPKDAKVVINTGNGTASAFAGELFRDMGLDPVEINNELDYNFPKYYPNPSVVEMMEELGEEVRRVGANIGLAFDGDGDRVGVVDDNGNIVWPDEYLIFLARRVLRDNPGAAIVFDVKCSRKLPEEIEKAGGNPVMWKTGHSYIKQKLQELAAPLGGEMSGHIFFNRPYHLGVDDALFAALKIVETLEDGMLSKQREALPKYVSTPSLQASCPDELKYRVVEQLTEEFKKEGFKVIDINGARVELEDGWGLVRASSNMPVLTLRFEAKDEETLKRIEELFRSKLERFEEVGKEWKSG